ncbi:LysR family transcriptional regulator [Sphingomonas sp. SUN039]|uniref:LysR family transcriptional regulator n=1 Tax=Sphingomonas sp. SUN039 TaxID=2937787 RepID=UPI002164E06E|nr:LysR family transcriptional regulator [Sphingomonas sp. SUN039]UVO54612.1 LysR family transcriptional regulator [Sphingomonas sp. SUN039]
MNLRHIEVFHAVYSNGSVSAAARALNVSQPSVSKTLRHAETLIGFPLFRRAAGRLIPTEDAHILFGDVADIQDRVQALREASRNMRRGTQGTLRISALPSLALDALPAAVAKFLTTHGDVRFDLQTVHHDDLLRKLFERETDIAIAYEAPANAPLAHTPLGRGELVALYREQDMPDAPPRLPLAALAGHRFISPVASGPLGRMFARELDRANVVLDDVVSARTFHIATSLVRHGAGLTVVDSFTAQAAMAPGLAWRPLDPAMGFEVTAMYLATRPPGALAASFLKAFAATIAQP